MTDGFVIGLGKQALLTVLLVAGPMLGLGLVTGLVVSVFQATTQINEQTLAFVPKMAAVLLTVVWFGPWMLSVLMTFTRTLIEGVPGWIR